MTFIAGELAATLQLNGKAAFDQALASSGDKFTTLQRIAKSAGDGIAVTLKAAGTILNLSVASATALGVQVFKTGAAYNQLQQSSRAALTTLLGSSQAVNAQMDKLDTFARTSPFAKSVFITAQQQMLGFGFAAKDVIPTLDAVQNAVAAVGGSNETLTDLVYIMSQIKAAGKITGQDLLQFGQRGVNAAELIGSAMGKTGGQIRDEITAGSLDANTALTALADGMAKKYGGTTALVKEQMAGAADRIKAATRDIGSALAAPFIDPAGGGRAVDWGNQVADLLRAVQAQATPFTNWAIQKLEPTFARVTDLLIKGKNAVNSWNFGNLDLSLSRLSTYGPGIAGAAGALSAFGTQIPIMQKLGLSINPVVGGIIGIVAASPEMRAAGGDLFRSLAPLVPIAAELSRVLAQGLNSALPVVADGVHLVASVAKPLVDILGKVPAPVLAGIAAFIAMRAVIAPLGSDTGLLTKVVQGLGERMALQTALAKAGGTQLTTFGAMAAVAGSGVTGLGLAIKAAFLSNPIGIALTIISGAIALFATANAQATERVEAHKQAVVDLQGTLDKSTGAITAQTREMLAHNLVTDGLAKSLKKLGISTSAYTDAMLGNDLANKTVRKSLNDIVVEQAKVVTGSRDAIQLAKTLGISSDVLSKALLGNADANKVVQDAVRTSGIDNRAYAETMGRLRYAMQDISPAASKLLDHLDDQQKKLAEAKAAQDLYNETMRRAAAEMTEAARSNARLNEAVAIARDTSKDATTRLRALKDALDELNGGSKTAQQAAFDLSSKILDLADAFNQTDANGKKLGASMVDAAGNIDRTTREGISLFGVVDTINDSMLSAMQSTFDLSRAQGDDLVVSQQKAQAAAQPFIDSLRQTAKDAGLTDGQINGLIATYLATPSVVTTLMTDNGTIDQIQQQVLTLTGKINDTPDHTITLNEPMSPIIMGALEALGVKVTTLPDGKIQVNASGIPEIESQLQNLTRARAVQVTIDALIRSGTAAGAAKAAYNADGGMWQHGVKAYANGGMEFANGGLPSGIYPGRPGGILKFAEPETGWEAFISGKAGQEARNRVILEDAAKRLGMQTVPINTGRSTAAVTSLGSTMTTGGKTDIVAALVEALRQAGMAQITVVAREGEDTEELAQRVADVFWRPR